MAAMPPFSKVVICMQPLVSYTMQRESIIAIKE